MHTNSPQRVMWTITLVSDFHITTQSSSTMIDAPARTLTFQQVVEVTVVAATIKTAGETEGDGLSLVK